MEAAVVQAMRDAIASMVIGFTSAPTVRSILFPETAAEPDGDSVPDIDALPAVGVDAETALLGEPGAGTTAVSDTEPDPDAADPGESPGESPGEAE